jgi:hypothetical protein
MNKGRIKGKRHERRQGADIVFEVPGGSWPITLPNAPNPEQQKEQTRAAAIAKAKEILPKDFDTYLLLNNVLWRAKRMEKAELLGIEYPKDMFESYAQKEVYADTYRDYMEDQTDIAAAQPGNGYLDCYIHELAERDLLDQFLTEGMERSANGQ